MSLKHEDVQEILKLLDDSPYDELNLQNDHFSLYLKRSGAGWTQETQTRGIGPGQAAVATSDSSADAQAEEPPPSEEGLLDIRSPMVGTFYRSPKPGAAPFVEIGSEVSDNSVFCIIEVMKLMSSIPAGVSGTVCELLAEDAQFVEKGQLLMRVRPAS